MANIIIDKNLKLRKIYNNEKCSFCCNDNHEKMEIDKNFSEKLLERNIGGCVISIFFLLKKNNINIEPIIKLFNKYNITNFPCNCDYDYLFGDDYYENNFFKEFSNLLKSDNLKMDIE